MILESKENNNENSENNTEGNQYRENNFQTSANMQNQNVLNTNRDQTSNDLQKNTVITSNQQSINQDLIPKFLQKFSNTFFKKVSLSVIRSQKKENQQKVQQEQQQQDQIQKTVQKKNYRSISQKIFNNKFFHLAKNSIKFVRKNDYKVIPIKPKNQNTQLTTEEDQVTQTNSEKQTVEEQKELSFSQVQKTPNQQINMQESQLQNSSSQQIQERKIFLSIQLDNKQNGKFNNNLNDDIKSIQIKEKMESNKSQIIKENENENDNENTNELQNEKEKEVLNQEKPQLQGDTSSILSKSVNTCIICYDRTPDSVFMNCGHGGVCYECSLDIWKKTGECYLCRLKIQQVLQIDTKCKYEGLIKVISATQIVKSQNCQNNQNININDNQIENQNAENVNDENLNNILQEINQ